MSTTVKEPVVVVGSGFSGAVIARRIAEQLKLQVLLLERRSHLAGNMYDETDEHGILVQRYGPHIICTDSYPVIAFLERFTTLTEHAPKLKARIDGRYVRMPYNFQTLQQLLGPARAALLLPRLRAAFPGGGRVPLSALISHHDEEIKKFAQLLFNKAFRPYIAKMWELPADALDDSVLARCPFALNYDERYQNKDFQYLPQQGFTALFQAMLDHPLIEIKLNCDARDLLSLNEVTGAITLSGQIIPCLVWTGALDELFSCRLGRLPYRSLDIRYSHHHEYPVLPEEIVSYPQAAGFTRSTEYRSLMTDRSKAAGSTVATEYPLNYDPDGKAGNEPYYPVLTEQSMALRDSYLRLAGKFPDLFLCGRLAEFKYYNMDICIEHALGLFGQISAHLCGVRSNES